jgi:hypothetical protein
MSGIPLRRHPGTAVHGGHLHFERTDGDGPNGSRDEESGREGKAA